MRNYEPEVILRLGGWVWGFLSYTDTWSNFKPKRKSKCISRYI